MEKLFSLVTLKNRQNDKIIRNAELTESAQGGSVMVSEFKSPTCHEIRDIDLLIKS